MDVHLKPAWEKRVRDEIAAGKYRDADHLVGSALEHFFIAQELGEIHDREEVGKMIDLGISQIARNESTDGPAFFEKLHQRGEKLRRKCQPK